MSCAHTAGPDAGFAGELATATCALGVYLLSILIAQLGLGVGYVLVAPGHPPALGAPSVLGPAGRGRGQASLAATSALLDIDLGHLQLPETLHWHQRLMTSMHNMHGQPPRHWGIPTPWHCTADLVTGTSQNRGSLLQWDTTCRRQLVCPA